MQKTARSRLIWRFGVPLLLILCTALAFWPTLQNDFTNWDDPENFLENSDYRGFGPSNVKWMFTTYHVGAWQPLAWTIFAIEFKAGGLDPLAYHTASLVMHLLNTVVLYFLTLQVLHLAGVTQGGHTRLIALLATLLFSLHPLRVEVVSWISSQPYLPAALFYMLTIMAYLRAHSLMQTGKRRWLWLTISLVLYSAAAMSKAAAVTLPAILLVLDGFLLRRSFRSLTLWAEKIPYVAISVSITVLALIAKSSYQSLAPLASYDVSARVAHTFRALIFALHKTLLPTDLCCFYPLPDEVQFIKPAFLMSAAVAVAITVLVVTAAFRLRYSAPLAAWICFVAMLLPNLGLMRIGSQLVADRYTYFPSLALCVFVAGVFTTVRRFRLIGLVVVVAICALLIVHTRTQVRTWASSWALWEHALAIVPDCAFAHNNMGVLLAEQGKVDEAIEHYTAALRKQPTNCEALNNMGLALQAQGNIEEAIGYYKDALQHKPDFALAHANLAHVLCGKGEVLDGITHYRKALRAKPDFADASYNIAVALTVLRREDDALIQCGETFRIDPQYADGYCLLGALLYRKGRIAEAIKAYREALRIDPFHARARAGLEGALAS